MEFSENLCLCCMKKHDSQDVCPYCGEEKNSPQDSPFLPKGTVIGKRYIVGKGLEMNGEGLGYVGYDKVKDAKVYVREFFPQNLCGREKDLTKVKPSRYHESIFEKQLNKFLKYFRSVARLRNLPALNAVYDIFKENGTAYVVLEWMDGVKLDEFVAEKGGSLKWDEARILFMPLISSLSKMHEAKVLHLGVNPGNIYVTDDGKLRLAGFAARDLRKADSPIESLLYDGCSALEQYIDVYSVDESTDVYGLTASIFLALTGEYPESAIKRKKDDRLLMPRDVVKSTPGNVISAIAGGLRVYPNNRTLSFDRLRSELSNSTIEQITAQSSDGSSQTQNSGKKSKRSAKNRGFILATSSCAITLIALAACFSIYWFGFKSNSSREQTQDEQNGSVTGYMEEENEVKKNRITAPNLVGTEFESIRNADPSELGYQVFLMSEEFNDDVEEGLITSQTPTAGEEIFEGANIAVNVSKGSKTRSLPNIAGKSLSEASILLSSAGLKPVETRDFNDSVPEGIAVGYKDCSAGDSIEYGSEVVVIISKGKK